MITSTKPSRKASTTTKHERPVCPHTRSRYDKHYEERGFIYCTKSTSFSSWSSRQHLPSEDQQSFRDTSDSTSKAASLDSIGYSLQKKDKRQKKNRVGTLPFPSTQDHLNYKSIHQKCRSSETIVWGFPLSFCTMRRGQS